MPDNGYVCKKGFEVKVFSSYAGYYIGTFDPEEGPNCRISGYYQKESEASSDLYARKWKDRYCVENQFCNEGSGCMITEAVN